MIRSKNAEFRSAPALRYLAPVLSYGKLVLRPTMLAERRRSTSDGKPARHHGQ
jgi:hypothetical protein